MKNKICGYVVLRKPQFNFDLDGKIEYLNEAPKSGGRYYGGIDRMEWFDFDDAFYEKRINKEFLQLFREKRENSHDLTAYPTFKEFEKVKKIWRFFKKERNEISVIFSEKLEAIKDSFESREKITWLGKDVFTRGGGSQLRYGYFLKPEIFSKFKTAINKNGLFDMDSDRIDEFIEAYTRLTLENNLEPMPVGTTDIILVGRVC